MWFLNFIEVWLTAWFWHLPHTWDNWVRYITWYSNSHGQHGFPCGILPDWKWRAVSGQCVYVP
jgi:hypothetical protein